MTKFKNFIFSHIENHKSKVNNIVMKESLASRKGIVQKTIFLLLITFFSTAMTFMTFSLFYTPADRATFNYILIYGVLFLCGVINLVLLFISIFSSVRAKKLISIIYSIVEGIMLGSFFTLLNVIYQNIFPLVLIAVLSVFVLFLLMHFAFYNNLIKVNNKFQKIIFLSFICLFIIDIVFSFVFPRLFISILVSFLSILIGFFSLAIDFQNAETIVNQNLSQEYEWFVAFGFQVTLIYIFMRIIQLMMYLGLFTRRGE